MKITHCGLYNVSDEYFAKFKCEFFTENKEEMRPYYLALTDLDGIIWLIPLSSQANSYRQKIEKDELKYGECLFYHIGKIADKERVFLIGQIIPITPKYIKKEFTISSLHYVVRDEKLVKSIRKKANKYLRFVVDGRLRPTINIYKFKEVLLADVQQ